MDQGNKIKGRALVLGPTAIGQRIALALKQLWFEPTLEKDLKIELPGGNDPDATEKLKGILTTFLIVDGNSGGKALIHPGVGDWANRSELVSIGQELGLIVISPFVRIVNLFSNKLNLLHEANSLGIPNLVLSFDPIYGKREIKELAKEKGRYPFVLKSAKGAGGGAGVHVVYSESDLDSGLDLWIEQIRRKFGEAILFAEDYVEDAKQITVPFARFQNGSIHFFPMVDSSLQVWNKKIVEFCPPPSLEPKAVENMQKWVCTLLEYLGYVGLGSFEFFVDGNRAYLFEALARLNTSFHLWEKIEGINAVEWQLATLNPDSIVPKQKKIKLASTGLSLRLMCEDPLLQIPQPGKICEVSQKREWKAGGSVAELDLAVSAGQTIEGTHDGNLGLIYAFSEKKDGAMAIAKTALLETWFSGSLQTNERFLWEILGHPRVPVGMFHAGFIEEDFVPRLRPPADLLEVFAQVCLMACSNASQKDLSKMRWVVGNHIVKPNDIEPKWVGKISFFEENEHPGVRGVLSFSGEGLRCCAFPVGLGRWLVRIGNWMMVVRRIEPTDPDKRKLLHVMALVSGRVHAILFQKDSKVPAHETVVIVESLQKLVPHALPIDVRVAKWLVKAEEKVTVGQPMAEIEKITKNNATQ